MCQDKPSGRKGQRFLTIRQVAEELGVSERSVWRLVEDDELPTHSFGSSTRIKREDLDAYIERCRRRRNAPPNEDDGEDPPSET